MVLCLGGVQRLASFREGRRGRGENDPKCRGKRKNEKARRRSPLESDQHEDPGEESENPSAAEREVERDVEWDERGAREHAEPRAPVEPEACAEQRAQDKEQPEGVPAEPRSPDPPT